jgi:FkbM family methyltransferase
VTHPGGIASKACSKVASGLKRSQNQVATAVYRALYGHGKFMRLMRGVRFASRFPFIRPLYWKLRQLLRPELVQVDGLRMHVHAHDVAVSDNLLTSGTFEPFETALICNLLKPGDVLLDIGANIGYHTVHGARAVGPSGRVISIEPARDNARLLRRNVAENGFDNVTVFECAAGESTGRLSLYEDEENKGDHRSYGIAGRSGYEVDVRAMDDILDELQLRPQLVKIDIQGFEYFAIKGLQRHFRAAETCVLISEFWSKGLRAAGVEPGQYVGLLRDLGFELHELDELNHVVTPLDSPEGLARLTDVERCTNLVCLKGVSSAELAETVRALPELAHVPSESEAEWVERTSAVP